MEAANPNEETNDERAASLATMSNTNMYNYENRVSTQTQTSNSEGYYYLGAITGPAISTAIAVTAKKTISHTVVATNFYRGFVIPVKSSTFESAAKFSKAFAAISLVFSIKGNFSEKCSKDEAWRRIRIDVISTASILIFCAGVGWVKVLV